MNGGMIFYLVLSADLAGMEAMLLSAYGGPMIATYVKTMVQALYGISEKGNHREG